MKKYAILARFTGCSLLCVSLFMPLHISAPTRTFAATKGYTESQAECVMEQTSRRILYENNGETRLPMASTTKIVTALTVLETCEDIGAEMEIPVEATGIEGSSVYLKSGETYSVEDLLYGLMLRSGNDCATALALYCSGSLGGFAAKMNKTAQKAGAIASNFKNPHGLPCDGHYTTARDLTLISCLAMENSTFRKIVSTKYYEPRHWKNKNKMLTEYEGGIGIKTGYTKQAGRCLVSAAEKEGMTLVCSVLNSPQMFERSAQLLDDAFKAYKMIKILSKDEIFSVIDGKKCGQGRVNEDFYYPLMEGEEAQLEICTKPCADKEIMGQIEIYLAKRLLFSGNLYKL